MNIDEERFRTASRQARWFFIAVGVAFAFLPAYRALIGVELSLFPEWALLAFAAVFVGVGVFAPARVRLLLEAFLSAPH